MVISPTDLDLERRVGTTWREIRRGASAARIKELFYEVDGEPIDQALADALSVVCQEGTIRMGELAERLHITPASTTRAVACLAKRGYVQRDQDPDDLRSVVVSATDEGSARYRTYNRRIYSGITQILAEFEPDEREQMVGFMERFVEAVVHYIDSEDTAEQV